MNDEANLVEWFVPRPPDKPVNGTVFVHPEWPTDEDDEVTES